MSRATDDGTAPTKATFFTLFRRGAISVDNFKSASSAIDGLKSFARKHPTWDAFVRQDITSDGTRWVMNGNAYGKLIADFSSDKERGGRCVVRY